jgi:hypothetical protein
MEQSKTMNNQILPKETPVEPRVDEQGSVKIQGHIKIFDPETKEVFIDKRNAIHYENFSLALAQSISNQGYGYISGMVFGNGGTQVDNTGIITYLTPNTIGPTAALYNQTYFKAIGSGTTDPRNFMSVRHVLGAAYSDVLVSCLLDFSEPSDQYAFDNTTNLNDTYVFDELGLTCYTPNNSNPLLLTHVIFHPVQKSLNRLIQIDYTVRIQALTGII